jgi:excisionase family DNA binding protein
MPTTAPTRPLTGLCNIDETAAALAVKPKTIRTWIAARRLGCVRLGRAVRVPQAEIDRVISQGTIPAREAF